MNIFLWVCQGFLAGVFLYSGIMKSYLSREKLVSIGQTGVDGLSYPLIRFIGISELLGAAGIILPEALQHLQVITPVTAVCFAIIMVLASKIHYKRKEPGSVVFNVLVFCISLFVALMRF